MLASFGRSIARPSLASRRFGLSAAAANIHTLPELPYLKSITIPVSLSHYPNQQCLQYAIWVLSSLLGRSTLTLDNVTLHFGELVTPHVDVQSQLQSSDALFAHLRKVLLQLQAEAGGRMKISIMVESIGALKQPGTYRTPALSDKYPTNPWLEMGLSKFKWETGCRVQEELMQVLQQFLPELHRQGALVLAPLDPDSIRLAFQIES